MTGYVFGPEDLPLGFDISEVKDLRQAPWSPWLKPDQSEATAAVVASVENLEQMMAELARLRAIVRDLAACPEPYNIEWAECQLCESERLIDGQGDMTTLHTPGCPWLRATQEVTP